MKFRTRLILVSAGAVAAAIMLASAVIFLLVRGQLRAEVDRALANQAATTTIAVNPEGGVSINLPEQPLGSEGFVRVIGAEGGVPARAEGDVVFPVSQTATQVAAGKTGPFYTDSTVLGIHVRVYTAPVAPGLALQVVRPLSEVDRVLGRLTTILAVVGLVGIGVAGVLGGLVARAALAPVRRLTETTAQVATTTDLSRRIEVTGGDELGRLAGSFNSMMEALEASLSTQRQLVADASHELRTPLTSLRTNIEVLARGERLAGPERDRLLADVVSQLEELTALVTDIVDLARGVESDPEPEDVRLDRLVQAAIRRAERNSPAVRFEASLEPTVVRGVPARIDRAVGNLLDNAAKWSPPGGTVEVTLRGSEVTVRDHGPGIDEADLPFVFDRFYRAPNARGRPGSGLGLAIVRQVAESHGGRASAEPAPGGGALLRLQLLGVSHPVLSNPSAAPGSP